MTDLRPKAKSELFDESRLTKDLGRRIDAWIAAQPEPRPTRQEAIRSLLDEALGKTAKRAPGWPSGLRWVTEPHCLRYRPTTRALRRVADMTAAARE
jgi:hypothetical protein